MRNKVNSEDPVLIVCCSYKYNTQRMCDELVDECLAALKFIPDWFVTSKVLENLIMLYTLMMIYSSIMKILIKSYLLLHIVTVDLDKVNLDNNNNFEEDDSDTNIHVGLLTWCSKFELKKIGHKRIVNAYSVAS